MLVESSIGSPLLSLVVAVDEIDYLAEQSMSKVVYIFLTICIPKEKEKVDCSLPVVIIADLIAAGLQSGWSVLRRPTTPET